VSVLRSVVLGCGSYLPERVLSNRELAASVDTSDEWIVQRTGIRQRHIAADGEVTSDLAIHAAKAALASAHVDPQSIDLIVVATSTPDSRSAGGLLGLRLCHRHHRRAVAHRHL
jgi:3-oxoacyl-[acyl-carrier-protein] synthase III